MKKDCWSSEEPIELEPSDDPDPEPDPEEEQNKGKTTSERTTKRGPTGRGEAIKHKSGLVP